MALGRFYIYEHLRDDNGRVFYVGKGQEARMRSTQHRNAYWRAVAAKGWTAVVRFRTDDEELAFLAECELIRKRRNEGERLTNMTDGGEGMAGYKFDPEVAARRMAYRIGLPNHSASKYLRGRPKTPEHRQRLSDARMGKTASYEARQKMSQARIGRTSSMKGKRHTQEAKDKISAASSGERNGFYGRRHTEETKAKQSMIHTGRRWTDAAKAKMSLSTSGSKNHNFGKPVSEERKQKQREALARNPKLRCPHCGTEADKSNAIRWHFDNCRRVV